MRKLVLGLAVGMFLLMATRAEAADPVSITVINQADGARNLTFGFSVSGQSTVYLKDDGVKQFTGLPAGSYKIAEVKTNGWKVSAITCYTGGVLQDINASDGDIVVTLAAGQSATCIFTNTPPGFGAPNGGNGGISVPTATPQPTVAPVSQVLSARAPQQAAAPRSVVSVITPPRTGDGGIR